MTRICSRITGFFTLLTLGAAGAAAQSPEAEALLSRQYPRYRDVQVY
jgi:hypothetical protein